MKTDQQGLAWHFQIRTDAPGEYTTCIAFDCNNGSGVGLCWVSLDIKDRPLLGDRNLGDRNAGDRGDLVFCGSPFDCDTADESLQSLVRILSALPLRLHCLDSLAQLSELGELRPRTIVLHRDRLLACQEADVQLLHCLASDGVNILVLADESNRNMTAAANRILAPFGMQWKRDGTEEPGIAEEELLRRIVEWHSRYNRAPFDSTAAEIASHPLTQGLNRVRWSYPQSCASTARPGH